VTQEQALSYVGKTVAGKYRLVRLVGSGGMGDVYEAQHQGIGRRFAIKFLHQLLAGNSEVVARFQREAQAAGGLENENIAAVVDIGTADDGVPFIVMEYLEGEDLARLLVRSGPLSVPRASFIAIQACRGLAAAHGRGIVHRDLKPENLFICKRNDGSDQVKILDFGIAKFHASTNLTQTGTTMGTPFYMSPEQARGAKEVDLRTDIYSLGVILYEMLSGTKAHPGDSYNEILYHVLTQEPTPLDGIRPGLPPGLSAVVAKALAREVADRFASAIEFITALIPFAGRAVTPAHSQVGLAPVAGVTMNSPVSLPAMLAATPIASPAPDATTSLRPRPRVGLWAAVTAVALLAAAMVWWPRHRGPEQMAEVPKPAPVLAPTAPDPMPATPPAPSPPTPEPPAAAEPLQEVPQAKRHPKRPSHSAAPARTPKAGPPAPSERPSEIPTRRKAIRSIDRQNPFGE
jgi:serine/threonine-protein kinase